MLGDPRQSVDNNEIVVEIDWTDRPSGTVWDLGVTGAGGGAKAAAAAVSVVVAAADSSALAPEVATVDWPAALLSRLSNSFTNPIGRKCLSFVRRLTNM